MHRTWVWFPVSMSGGLQLPIIPVYGDTTYSPGLWEHCMYSHILHNWKIKSFLKNNHKNFSNFMKYVLHIIKYIHSMHKIQWYFNVTWYNHHPKFVFTIPLTSFIHILHNLVYVSSPGYFKMIYFLSLYLLSELCTWMKSCKRWFLVAEFFHII